jgi:hypothetical protein
MRATIPATEARCRWRVISGGGRQLLRQGRASALAPKSPESSNLALPQETKNNCPLR